VDADVSAPRGLLPTLARGPHSKLPVLFGLSPERLLQCAPALDLPEARRIVAAVHRGESIARLAGDIKNNGQPGRIVLGRGFERLLALEWGWNAALGLRSDKS
jgi:hypothetical protein